MLKIGSKRRRTKAEIKAEKEETVRKELEIQQKLAAADQMQAQFLALQDQAQNNQNAHDILCDFLKKGVLVKDSEGNVLPAPGMDR